MYKIILCDLDGTLLNDERIIPKINLEYINKAIDKGCKFVLCSGRSNMSLNNFNKEMGLNKKGNLCIGYNGSIIYEADTLKVLYEKPLQGKLAKKCIEISRKYDVDILVYYNEKLYYEKFSDRIDIYAKRSKLIPVELNNLEEICVNGVSKVIIIGDKNILDNIDREVYETKLNKKVTTFFSAKDLYEFNPLNINKGSALEKLSEILGIDKSKIIAIGDNQNDIYMIEKAGLGVAVANGTEETKKAANYITKSSNNEGAVAEVIMKFIL